MLPIDLPTALRLVNASNPTVALARARVDEAYGHLREAQVLWLPNLNFGHAYQRHDGRIQNAAGVIFDTSKSNLFVGGGPVLSLDTSEALFGPLVAQRLVDAQVAQTRAVSHNVQLDAALAYQDLLRVYGQLAINTDTLKRAEDLLLQTERAAENELARRPADVNRARTEVEQRRRERIDIEADLAAVSARLAQLLLLKPTVDLRPAEPTVLPVELVPACASIDELVAAGLLNRPELAESRALVAAALAQWRQARVGPFIPRIDLSYTGGTFGGGMNEFMGNFAARGDGTADLVWVGHNFFAGDVTRARVRQTQYNEANLHVAEVQARVAAEVTTAAKLVRARRRSLDSAQAAVTQALEAWRKLRLATYGLGDPRSKLLDTLEPLVALQTLAQARAAYLTQVVEYNKAQFQLYTAMGQPPIEALPAAQTIPLAVPSAPPSSTLTPPGQP